jgi:hypothetical protein
MRDAWPPISYERWGPTCDTVHAHTQVLGKLAVKLAPPEPELQHAALRLTARGWETAPLPAPNGSGAFVAGLDLRAHQAFVEHSRGGEARVELVGERAVADVSTELLDAIADLAGGVEINPAPQEVPWTVPLDQDREHATYDPDAVCEYFIASTRAALALAEFRAPYRGRLTPVNAWWGSFDLAVNLFTGDTAQPPSNDFIMRNAMDAQDFATGWWPGDPNHGDAAFYAYAHPPREGWPDAQLSAGGWSSELGEYLLEWADVIAADDPHALALRFMRETFAHACMVCGWDPSLAASGRGEVPAIV